MRSQFDEILIRRARRLASFCDYAGASRAYEEAGDLESAAHAAWGGGLVDRCASLMARLGGSPAAARVYLAARMPERAARVAEGAGGAARGTCRDLAETTRTANTPAARPSTVLHLPSAADDRRS